MEIQQWHFNQIGCIVKIFIIDMNIIMIILVLMYMIQILSSSDLDNFMP